MALPHRWAECSPVVLDRVTGRIDEKQTAQVVEIFRRRLSPQERILFHQFTCHSRHGDQQMALINKFAKMVEEETA